MEGSGGSFPGHSTSSGCPGRGWNAIASPLGAAPSGGGPNGLPSLQAGPAPPPAAPAPPLLPVSSRVFVSWSESESYRGSSSTLHCPAPVVLPADSPPPDSPLGTPPGAPPPPISKVGKAIAPAPRAESADSQTGKADSLVWLCRRCCVAPRVFLEIPLKPRLSVPDGDRAAGGVASRRLASVGGGGDC